MENAGVVQLTGVKTIMYKLVLQNVLFNMFSLQNNSFWAAADVYLHYQNNSSNQLIIQPLDVQDVKFTRAQIDFTVLVFGFFSKKKSKN